MLQVGDMRTGNPPNTVTEPKNFPTVAKIPQIGGPVPAFGRNLQESDGVDTHSPKQASTGTINRHCRGSLIAPVYQCAEPKC
jgi:hypothetical protein